MGAAAALQVAIRHPGRVRSAVLASIGTGSDAKPEELQAQMENMAKLIESQGLENLALSMANQPARKKLREKNPAELEKFMAELGVVFDGLVHKGQLGSRLTGSQWAAVFSSLWMSDLMLGHNVSEDIDNLLRVADGLVNSLSA